MAEGKREWDKEQAEQEAQLAADELHDWIEGGDTQEWTPRVAVKWLAEWVERHYLICGHKRLGRILLEHK